MLPILEGTDATHNIHYRLIRVVGGGVRVLLVPQDSEQARKAEVLGNGLLRPIASPKDHCWCGDNYATQSQRLLILSESFYDTEGNLKNNPSKALVERCALTEKTKVTYYRKLFRICTGQRVEEAGFAAVNEFWQKTALFHHVQSPIKGPRMAPSNKQMIDHLLQTIQLTQALGATTMLIPSKRLWYFLAQVGIVTKSEPFVGHFHHIQGSVAAAAIGHPSAFTKYEDSRKQVLKLFELSER